MIDRVIPKLKPFEFEQIPKENIYRIIFFIIFCLPLLLRQLDDRILCLVIFSKNIVETQRWLDDIVSMWLAMFWLVSALINHSLDSNVSIREKIII